MFVVHCQLQCYNQTEVEQGLKEKIFWVPFVFDMRNVVGVKGYIDAEFKDNPNITVIYMGSGHAFVIDQPIDSMSRLFTASRSLSFPIAQLSQH